MRSLLARLRPSAPADPYIYRCVRCGYVGHRPPVIGSTWRCMNAHDVEAIPASEASPVLRLLADATSAPR